MSSISKNDNSEFDFDLQDLNQGYISNRMLSDLDSLDSLLDDVPVKLPDPLPFASNSAPELKIEVARQPEPTHITLPAPFNKANLYQLVDDTVLTPAELAIFEIEISKMATNELADFEDNSSKMAIANFEKPVSKMASDETSEFWEPARTQNAPKTPEMRAIQHVPQNGASLRIINTYNKTTQNTLKTPFTNHPKTGLKTKKQKITPKPTLFTLAKNEPLHTPDGIKPRPAITSRTIEELADPFRRRWHDLNLNDKLALSFIETERHGGYSFRLTFSAQLAWKLLAASDPATVFCRDHLRPALKQEFGKVLPYSFRFEFSKEGTLHIHGAIIIPEMERTGIEQRLQSVLNKAGGSTGTGTQSHVAPLYDPLRYFYYLEKSAKETRSKMEHNLKGITAISGELKQLIKALHDNNRTNAK